MNIEIGSTVKVEIDGHQNEFVVIAAGDPTQYKVSTISADSQIGQALIGKSVGESAEIIIEGIPRTYKIIAII